MGWLISYEKLRHGETVDSRMRQEMSWSNHDAASGEKHEIIASSTVGSVWYAAVKHTWADGTFKTFAVICLTRKSGNGMGFGYKDMDETCGPNECSCPAYILDLLTATDSEYANDWRHRCRTQAASKRAIRATFPKPGARVVFKTPIPFGGVYLSDFIVVPTPPHTRGLIARRTDEIGGLYRLPTSRLGEATITQGAI